MKNRVSVLPLKIMILLCAMLAFAVGVAQAEDAKHKIVLHVDQNDAKVMNLVLNNASNINNYYLDKGEEAKIEIVTYGPGLHMLREDTSPVKKRIKSISESYDNVSFKACGNTHRKMSKKEGKDVPLVKQADKVPSGIIHLITRSEEGWTYIRP